MAVSDFRFLRLLLGTDSPGCLAARPPGNAVVRNLFPASLAQDQHSPLTAGYARADIRHARRLLLENSRRTSRRCMRRQPARSGQNFGRRSFSSSSLS